MSSNPQYQLVTIEAPKAEGKTPVLFDAVSEGFKPLLMQVGEGKVYILIGRKNEDRAGQK